MKINALIGLMAVILTGCATPVKQPLSQPSQSRFPSVTLTRNIQPVSLTLLYVANEPFAIGALTTQYWFWYCSDITLSASRRGIPYWLNIPQWLPNSVFINAAPPSTTAVIALSP
ncbi:hypothetical protein [Xenorhabdus ehlersii]|uniref:PilL protein n=1 Tax=Xenorhabdus ehlersii TaxID=290111 RepID=A0A2D0IJH4_9GAMM|nr:hypothetical protein [Xenorhabdus ehlersii]PHM21894.1 PilL protein [Xenorhabdus ehlersii]RKE93006.1 hypothetical protein BDE27_0687 [Xenorhabdus ehlersii]